jgi:hypothetical protein
MFDDLRALKVGGVGSSLSSVVQGSALAYHSLGQRAALIDDDLMMLHIKCVVQVQEGSLPDV